MTRFIYIVLGVGVMTLALLAFIYYSTDPDTIEAKELRGMVSEGAALFEELQKVNEEYRNGRLTKNFYTEHIEDIEKELGKLQGGILEKKFDTDVLLKKEEILSAFSDKTGQELKI